MDWYLQVLGKYVEFTGRARRKEYWMFALINAVIAISIGVVEGLLGSPGIIGGLYALFVFLPSLAVAIRRLHDSGKTGWWILVVLVPIIGLFVFIYFMVVPGDLGANEHGPDPLTG
jgi:uncharacterized membrane protein YhaH (DUF805 family)